VVNRCLLLNARNLKNKLCDFNHLLSDDYLAVAVTESWLNSSISNGMIDTSGKYSVHRNEFYVWLLRAGRHSQYHFLKSFKISTFSL